MQGTRGISNIRNAVYIVALAFALSVRGAVSSLP